MQQASKHRILPVSFSQKKNLRSRKLQQKTLYSLLLRTFHLWFFIPLETSSHLCFKLPQTCITHFPQWFSCQSLLVKMLVLIPAEITLWLLYLNRARYSPIISANEYCHSDFSNPPPVLFLWSNFSVKWRRI